jgi:hypothetical protein
MQVRYTADAVCEQDGVDMTDDVGADEQQCAEKTQTLLWAQRLEGEPKKSKHMVQHGHV